MNYGTNTFKVRLDPFSILIEVQYGWEYDAEEGSVFAPSEHYVPEHLVVWVDFICQIDERGLATGGPLSLNEGINIKEVKEACLEHLTTGEY